MEPATTHVTRPHAMPIVAPAIIATPVSLAQNMVRIMGVTEDPIRMPMKLYTAFRFTYKGPNIKSLVMPCTF